MAEDEPEDARPEDLVNQAGCPRAEEAKGDRGKDLPRFLFDLRRPNRTSRSMTSFSLFGEVS